MKNELMDTVQVMDSTYGIDISKYDDTFLKQAIKKRCAATEAKTLSEYNQYLSGNVAEVQILFVSLNITYTEFFRNTLTFAHLEQWILPELIERKSKMNELRIWSAGCSTGQEAYSIAMLIENLCAKKTKAFRYRIIATDISESALTVARRGEYNKEAIQNIRVRDVNSNFEKAGETYKVCERVRKHVSFSIYDLLDNLCSYPQESIFGNFDLVICSNLLFYYQPEYQHRILKKLINSMAGNGYLISGEAERHVITKVGGLRTVVPPSPIFQRKAEA